MTTNGKNGKSRKQNSVRHRPPEEPVSPAIGAIIGAAAGAVVGSVLIKIMGDENSRKKAGRLLNKSIDVLKDINEQPQGFQAVADESISNAVTKTKRFLQGK